MLYGADLIVEKSFKNNVTSIFMTFIDMAKLSKGKVCYWWIVLNYSMIKTCHIRLRFLGGVIHKSQFKMLEESAALCQPRHHIILNWETLLSYFIEGKLLEAVVSEVLAQHKVNDLVHHF